MEKKKNKWIKKKASLWLFFGRKLLVFKVWLLALLYRFYVSLHFLPCNWMPTKHTCLPHIPKSHQPSGLLGYANLISMLELQSSTPNPPLPLLTLPSPLSTSPASQPTPLQSIFSHPVSMRANWSIQHKDNDLICQEQRDWITFTHLNYTQEKQQL